MGETRICFFCEKATAEEKSNYPKKLRKSTSDANDVQVSEPNQVIKIVDVPRCPRCKSIHTLGFVVAILMGLSIGIWWYWYFVYVNNGILNWIDSSYDPEICEKTGACTPSLFQFWGLIIGLILGNFIINNSIRIVTKPLNDADNYILVVIAKDRGYQ